MTAVSDVATMFPITQTAVGEIQTLFFDPATLFSVTETTVDEAPTIF
jgi:hypothetical protein